MSPWGSRYDRLQAFCPSAVRIIQLHGRRDYEQFKVNGVALIPAKIRTKKPEHDIMLRLIILLFRRFVQNLADIPKELFRHRLQAALRSGLLAVETEVNLELRFRSRRADGNPVEVVQLVD